MVGAGGSLRGGLPRNRLCRLRSHQYVRGHFRCGWRLEATLSRPRERLAPVPRLYLRVRLAERFHLAVRVPPCDDESHSDRAGAVSRLPRPRDQRRSLDRRGTGGRPAGHRRRGPPSSGRPRAASAVSAVFTQSAASNQPGLVRPRSASCGAACCTGSSGTPAPCAPCAAASTALPGFSSRLPDDRGYLLFSCGGRNTICTWLLSADASAFSPAVIPSSQCALRACLPVRSASNTIDGGDQRFMAVNALALGAAGWAGCRGRQPGLRGAVRGGRCPRVESRVLVGGATPRPCCACGFAWWRRRSCLWRAQRRAIWWW